LWIRHDDPLRILLFSIDGESAGGVGVSFAVENNSGEGQLRLSSELLGVFEALLISNIFPVISAAQVSSILPTRPAQHLHLLSQQSHPQPSLT
jgi:hypothetical protein